jgi:hypothetical protein
MEEAQNLKRERDAYCDLLAKIEDDLLWIEKLTVDPWAKREVRKLFDESRRVREEF